MIFTTDELSQIFGTKDIYVDKIHRKPFKINCIGREEPILNSLIDVNLQSLYNRNLYEYAKDLAEYEDVYYMLELRDAIHEEMDDRDLTIFENHTHGNFWNYQLERAKDGEIKIKKKKKKKRAFIDYHLPKDQNTFVNNIPVILRTKVIDVLHKHNLEVAMDFCYCEDSSLSAIFLYEKEIFEDGHLLNDLFNIQNDAIGKGEAVMAFIFRDSTINGLTASFDLQLKDAENGVEIKAPKASFRIGVNGSIGSSFFFSHILKARETLQILVNQLGEERFRNYVGKDFYELSIQLLTKGNFKEERALSSAIDYAELSAFRLSLIKLWFYLAHVKVGWLIDNNGGVVFDPASEKYRCSYGDMTKATTDRDVLAALSFHRYVRSPELFSEDLGLEVNGWFKHIGSLVIFNEAEKTISIYDSPDEIVVDAISQNGFKVIEERFKKKENTSIEEAFKKWDNDPDIDFYETYCELDSQYKKC